MKNLLLFGLLVFFSFSIEAQNVALVDYMKVPDNGEDAYIAVEKQWKTLHQSRVASGAILGWELYAVRGSGASSPYNFVTVTVYENFAKTDVQFTDADFTKAFGKTYTEFLNKTSASRKLIYSETYHFAVGIASDNPDKFIVVNSIHTNNVDKYINMEKVGYMPVHTEAKKLGQRNSWGIWTLWPNQNNDVQAVAVDGYSKFSDINSFNFEDAIGKAIAGKKPFEIYEMMEQIYKTDEMRTIVKTEIWEMLDATTPKK